MTKDAILKKVEKREQQKAFVERCLRVRICPDCGDDLVEEDAFMVLECESCGSSWNVSKGL